MSRSSIFSAIRSSPVFLKPPAIPAEAVQEANGSLGLTLFALVMGWFVVLGITIAIACDLRHAVSVMLFIASLLANLVLVIVVVLLVRRFAGAHVQAFPVIVSAKKRERSPFGNENDGNPYLYWFTFEFEDGSHGVHAVSEELFFQIHPPCAGVAHLHSYEGLLVRYDPVLDKIELPCS